VLGRSLSDGGSGLQPGLVNWATYRALFFVLLAVLDFGGRVFTGTTANRAVSHSGRRIAGLLGGCSTSRRLTGDV